MLVLDLDWMDFGLDGWMIIFMWDLAEDGWIWVLIWDLHFNNV